MFIFYYFHLFLSCLSPQPMPTSWRIKSMTNSMTIPISHLLPRRRGVESIDLLTAFREKCRTLFLMVRFYSPSKVLSKFLFQTFFQSSKVSFRHLLKQSLKRINLIFFPTLLCQEKEERSFPEECWFCFLSSLSLMLKNC